MNLSLTILTGSTVGVGAGLVARAYRRGRQAGAGPVGRGSVTWSAVGAIAIVVASVGPVHDWAETSLAGHMTQHVVFLLAPLALVLGKTGTAMLLGLEPQHRARVSRRLRASRFVVWTRLLTRRPIAWALLVVTVGMWHFPPIFEAATASEPLHALEHGSLLAVGAVYWVSVAGGSRRREQASALVSIFGVMLVGTAFGALLTFASEPWYPATADQLMAAGVDWLQDQQTAGLVMWIPPSVALLALFLGVAASWLNGVEERSARVEVGS